MIPLTKIRPGLRVRYNGKFQTVESFVLFRDPDGEIMRKESVVYFRDVLDAKPLMHLRDKGFATTNTLKPRCATKAMPVQKE